MINHYSIRCSSCYVVLTNKWTFFIFMSHCPYIKSVIILYSISKFPRLWKLHIHIFFMYISKTTWNTSKIKRLWSQSDMELLMVGRFIKLRYRVTQKGCDFSDDIKLLKSSEFKGASVSPFHIDLGGVYKQYCKRKYRQEIVTMHVIC